MEARTTRRYFGSNKISLLILAASAMVCSRALFYLFNDIEGPNLLIVIIFAVPLFVLAAAAHLYLPASIRGILRLLAGIGIQILLVAVFFFCMK